ncbi:hypothetical protein Cgig2_000652 [Carnegiea gigantea]|uniref:Uncharacterized protein n=1 Tax=Carnegiea gigantea TaxID=171969 RepID=A0A9Q1GPS6_9CARY|nr:hypothetical protein Cgig2_000652 [Carnegiea gigantea]
MFAIQKINVLKVKSRLEKQASQVLTPFAFEMFKEECSRSIQYLTLYVSGNNFIWRYYEGSHKRSHKNLIFSEYSAIIYYGYFFRRILIRFHLLICLLAGVGNDILHPLKSTMKGRPRKKQMKAGKESTKRSRHYSNAKNLGIMQIVAPRIRKMLLFLTMHRIRRIKQ